MARRRVLDGQKPLMLNIAKGSLMEPVGFDAVSYIINGDRRYLYSGEFHYFRVPRAAWKRRMRLLKDAGGNAVATYIPWLIHEPVEGKFAFHGKPWLEVERFLETAAEENLYVIARPGPYVYSELVYGGLPRWLCENYPVLRAKNRDGKDFRRSSISYLHPLFLEKAERWYDRVCPLIARHSVSRGGAIAFAQIDNELAGIHTWFGSLDYNRTTMGFGRENGRYPRWLAARYGSIEELNAAYETAFHSFAAVEPPVAVPADTDRPPDMRRARDYFEFYLAGIAEYGLTLAGWMRRRGIDVPLVHNSAGPTMNAWFRELNAALKPEGFIQGSDHYYTLSQDWSQNNPTPQYAVHSFMSLESLRLMNAPPTVFELPGGSLSDWPPIGEEDARACYFTNLAMGMKGHNLYIFTGGKNPPNAGSTDDIYDYCASVGANGEIRPLYRAQRALGAFLKKHPFFPAASRESDCRALLDWDAARANQWTRRRAPFVFAPHESWDFLRKGILTTAFCAGLSPEMVDAAEEDWAANFDTPLVAATSSIMSKALQHRLVSFLARGGRLLFGPALPEFDEFLRPCSILRDFLGAGSVKAAPAGATARFPFCGLVYANGITLAAAHPPRGAAALARVPAGKACLAWDKKIKGGGRAIWLGVQWSHGNDNHTRLLRGCLDRLGVAPRLTVSNPNVWCSLRTNGGRSVLFAMNLFTARQSADIVCRPAWSAGPIQLRGVALPGMTVKTIDLGS